MKRIIKITSIALLSVLSTLSIANEDGFNIADELQYDSSKQKSEISISISPLEAWNNYLTKHNLNDGFNERNGRVFFVGFGSEVVGNGGSIVKSPGFLDARTSAYGIALLAAKAELANNLSSELSSERALTMFKISEDAAPAFREKVIKPLSLMDKAHKLTDLALDDQIKKFDPEWTGENKNKEEKLTALRKYILIYSENLSQKTKQFLQGATPVFNAEGPNHRGNYSVGVGIVWSAKSTKVAEAVYNPYSKTPKGKKKLLTIKDQLKNLNDKELASTYGSRIWWDEKGSPVVVSFASTDDQGFDTTAKRLTSMTARNQISIFVAEQIVADFKNKEAIIELAEKSDIITYEIESGDSEVLKSVEKNAEINPSPDTLKIIQDKFLQKSFLLENNIPVPEFIQIENIEQVKEGLKKFGYPALLKARRDAYDGKGNYKINSENEIQKAFDYFKGQKLLLEKYVPFKMEVSIIASRNTKGQIKTYPLVENIHEENILRQTIAPARVSKIVADNASIIAEKTMSVLKGAGIFGIEMFVTDNDEITINEIAPRVHNSGHHTLHSSNTSQFEQHLRAILGIELNNTDLIHNTVMHNILGSKEFQGEYIPLKIDSKNVFLKMYGKEISKPLRKLGHVNLVANEGETIDDLLEKLKIIKEQTIIQPKIK